MKRIAKRIRIEIVEDDKVVAVIWTTDKVPADEVGYTEEEEHVTR